MLGQRLVSGITVNSGIQLMRPLVLMSLIVSVAACSGNSTQPTSMVINVTVRDDRGAPVDRMPVTVTVSEANQVNTRTRRDGTVGIGIAGEGVYLVRVIPRAGYVGSAPGLTKTVRISANEDAAVSFTVYREGVSTAEPPVERFPWGT